ncbi:hypothetical protein L1281_002030 [Neisseria sp. HSC-16F19]|nr:hypothetical protein [Neisseria sp. HSC-16F19]MCP2041430.1 hypothetical protein [Neisseria sp. HSC-16F19]
MKMHHRIACLLPLLLCTAAAADAVYICRLGNKAVYTSYPQKLPKGQCQKSAMEPVDAVSASDAAASDPDAADPISQLWYDLEFGNIDNNIKISHPEPIVTPPAARGGSGVNTALLPPPKPPTRRQLVERDIAAEKKALAAAQAELAAAQAAKQYGRINRINLNISDRLQNIRALETELQRY